MAKTVCKAAKTGHRNYVYYGAGKAGEAMEIKPNKRYILDACCESKMFWFGKMKERFKEE